MADAKLSVVSAALEATQPVVAALYKGIGVDAEAFPEVCLILEAAMRNPQHEEASIRATRMMQDAAQRLSKSAEKVRQSSQPQSCRMIGLTCNAECAWSKVVYKGNYPLPAQ